MAPLFDRIDTLILRVADHRAAAGWYAAALGLQTTHDDDGEGLSVLSLPQGSSLTLWQRKPGEAAAVPDAQGAYPIFATGDAVAAREELRRRNVRVGELEDGPGVRWFTFHDPDGNRLEACEVLEA